MNISRLERSKQPDKIISTEFIIIKAASTALSADKLETNFQKLNIIASSFIQIGISQLEL